MQANSVINQITEQRLSFIKRYPLEISFVAALMAIVTLFTMLINTITGNNDRMIEALNQSTMAVKASNQATQDNTKVVQRFLDISYYGGLKVPPVLTKEGN